jgi:cytidylate kinase
VIGDLKTGKSSVAKGLATKLDLVYVEPEELLEASFKRVLLYEAKEDTEEEPEEAILNTDSLVDNVDLNVVSQLRQGKRVDDRLIILLLNRKLKETTTIRKGFVLDLPFYIQQLNKQ